MREFVLKCVSSFDLIDIMFICQYIIKHHFKTGGVWVFSGVFGVKECVFVGFVCVFVVFECFEDLGIFGCVFRDVFWGVLSVLWVCLGCVWMCLGDVWMCVSSACSNTSRWCDFIFIFFLTFQQWLWW